MSGIRVTFLFAALLGSPAARAEGLSDFTQQTMAEVVKIARAIAVVQPRLDEAKYVEYALGIYRASKRFDIETDVLVSIAQQESGFRENLKEGAAGEIGICQIRKLWLTNRAFTREFPGATIRDLKTPSKQFMMAAWILRDLKTSVTSKTLPYWSFYNARKFENRFKYFLLVNRNIASLRRHAASQAVKTAAVERVPAAKPTPNPALAARLVEPKQGSLNAYWAPETKKVSRDTFGEIERSIAD